jgi:hypothetical protein
VFSYSNRRLGGRGQLRDRLPAVGFEETTGDRRDSSHTAAEMSGDAATNVMESGDGIRPDFVSVSTSNSSRRTGDQLTRMQSVADRSRSRESRVLWSGSRWLSVSDESRAVRSLRGSKRRSFRASKRPT